MIRVYLDPSYLVLGTQHNPSPPPPNFREHLYGVVRCISCPLTSLSRESMAGYKLEKKFEPHRLGKASRRFTWEKIVPRERVTLPAMARKLVLPRVSHSETSSPSLCEWSVKFFKGINEKLVQSAYLGGRVILRTIDHTDGWKKLNETTTWRVYHCQWSRNSIISRQQSIARGTKAGIIFRTFAPDSLIPLNNNNNAFSYLDHIFKWNVHFKVLFTECLSNKKRKKWLTSQISCRFVDMNILSSESLSSLSQAIKSLHTNPLRYSFATTESFHPEFQPLLTKTSLMKEQESSRNHMTVIKQSSCFEMVLQRAKNPNMGNAISRTTQYRPRTHGAPKWLKPQCSYQTAADQVVTKKLLSEFSMPPYVAPIVQKQIAKRERKKWVPLPLIMHMGKRPSFWTWFKRAA